MKPQFKLELIYLFYVSSSIREIKFVI